MTQRSNTRVGAPPIHIKRAYEPPTRVDGYRVLVDRLWPRGVAKEKLALGAWHKELAPSDSLRRWFAHEPARWSEFMKRYQKELRATDASVLLGELAERARAGTVTLVYGARDEEQNNAVVLRDELERRLRTAGTRGQPSRKEEAR
jgi:uncharacterized protein YeaO (DUF488 family)